MLMIENTDLKNKVNKTNGLKQLIVDYVGNKINPEKEEITLEMVIEIFSQEFPELLLTSAEENRMIGFMEGIDYVNQFKEKKSDKS